MYSSGADTWCIKSNMREHCMAFALFATGNAATLVLISFVFLDNSIRKEKKNKVLQFKNIKYFGLGDNLVII